MHVMSCHMTRLPCEAMTHSYMYMYILTSPIITKTAKMRAMENAMPTDKPYCNMNRGEREETPVIMVMVSVMCLTHIS